MVTPALRERVLRGVDLFKRGLAKYLILTGGPAHNQYVEADVMAKFAESKGVPANRIIEEKEARNTIENASRSVKIMRTRGWSKAIIVTSSAHLLRSNFIFSRHHIQYRMVACNDPLEQDLWTKIQSDQSEKYKTLATLLLRLK
ncbi:MAG: YdcF family protein [Cyanobacteria bacterium]|nr:YdcF family protein [Cyanobacteriota bacterium]